MVRPPLHLAVRGGYGLREAAVCESDRLIDYVLDVLTAPGAAPPPAEGDLYWARVTRIDTNLGAAFLDLGRGQQAIMTDSGARFAALSGAGPAAETGVSLARRLPEGTLLLAQIDRAPEPPKIARATTRVRLAGRHSVLAPAEPGVALPRTVRREGRLDRLESLTSAIAALLPDGIGAILRTAAAGAAPETVLREAQRLVQTWCALTVRPSGPARVLAGEDRFRQLLIALDRPPDTMAVEPVRAWAETLAILRQVFPESAPHRLTLPPGTDVFAAAGVEDSIAGLSDTHLDLACGGRISLQTTEIGVAVDVDRSKSGRSDGEINTEAADEIGRQIRLRRLGGRVIVDFIDLQSRKDAALLIDRLRSAVDDETGTLDIGFDPMSRLVLLNRRKTGPGLAERVRAACPACAGTGVRPTQGGALRSALLALERRGTLTPRLRADPATARRLAVGDPAWRGEAAEQFGRVPDIIADPALPPGTVLAAFDET